MDDAQRLILAVTSPQRDPSLLRALLRSCSDWDTVFRIAERHHVLNQLAVVITSLGVAKELPPAVENRIQRLNLHAALVEAINSDCLRRVVDRFDAARIPFLVLKGHGLAERMYEDARERPARDTDILIARHDYPRAREALQSLGFAPYAEEIYRRRHFHVCFFKPGKLAPLDVELHWDVVPPDSPVRLLAEDWWSEAPTVDLRAGKVRLPPPDVELLYAAHHAFQMFNVTLRGLGDFARCLQAFDASRWDSLLVRAERSGVAAFLREALHLVSEFWGIEAATRTAPLATDAPRRWLSRNILLPTSILAAGSGVWWAYRRIGYWSMLPQSEVGLARLFAGSDLRVSELTNGGARRSRLRESTALLLALGLCCLPRQLHSPTWRATPHQHRVRAA